ncbi:putative methyltransferase PMT5 [Artemisia annua]|uniref:Putative methyltransferase PMT5 n=1 Tax=Artemisia annua TaxID=35608 RepID=A0A2U1QLJ1_ARTAN|nr:putative methyltransferase PMT5 [Artemisia annua]
MDEEARTPYFGGHQAFPIKQPFKSHMFTKQRAFVSPKKPYSRAFVSPKQLYSGAFISTKQQIQVHTVLVIGCGFGRFGAHLLSLKLMTVCFAAYDRVNYHFKYGGLLLKSKSH